VDVGVIFCNQSPTLLYILTVVFQKSLKNNTPNNESLQQAEKKRQRKINKILVTSTLSYMIIGPLHSIVSVFLLLWLPAYVGVSNFLGGDQFPIPTRYKISVWGGDQSPPHTLNFRPGGGPVPPSPPPRPRVVARFVSDAGTTYVAIFVYVEGT